MPGVYVIANPKAGRGAVGERWERLLGELHRAGLDPLGDLTQRPGHGTELAKRARQDGHALVVAAGGDGTVNEVVNGLLADGLEGDIPALGVLSLGTGGDYVKTFGLPEDLAGSVARLASPDPPRVVDVGEVRFGNGEARYFVNVAEVGFGPEVVRRAQRLPRQMGSAVYLAAFWMMLPGFRRRRIVARDDGVVYEGPCMNVVVAIGQLFGGGMRIAPGADPSDGLFDVQFHVGSKLDYVAGIAKVYKGTHLPHPKIHECRAAELEVTSEPEALIEMDGEVVGSTPVVFRTHAGALRLKV